MKISPNLSADSLGKTPKTNPSFTIIGRQGTDPVNAPSGIDTKQNNWLGFMEGEGRVPDDFNTMGAKKIEDLFLKGR